MKPISLAIIAVLLSACSTRPVLTSGMDPSDPAAPVPPVEYTPVTPDVAEYQPVAPKPWVEQNRAVAPTSPSAAR